MFNRFLNYDDQLNDADLNSWLQTKTSDDIEEGVQHLYFTTTERNKLANIQSSSSINTANTLVLRDISGSFSTSDISAFKITTVSGLITQNISAKQFVINDISGYLALNSQQLRLRQANDINHIIQWTNDDNIDGIRIRGNGGGLIDAGTTNVFKWDSSSVVIKKTVFIQAPTVSQNDTTKTIDAVYSKGVNLSGAFLSSSPSSNNFTSNSFTYNISASTIYFDNNYPAYKAFSTDTGGTGWASASLIYNASGNAGAYTGSVSTNNYLGEWVQIQRSKAFTVSSYTIRKNGDSQYPVDFKLFASNDGTTWTEIDSRVGATYPAGNNTIQTFTLATSVTYSWFRLVTNKIVPSGDFNTLQFKGLSFNGTNERSTIGIGVEIPTGQLELATDTAYKPSTNTWTTSSDERLKEDIVIANYDTCYNIVKELDLKYYKWKDIEDLHVNDKHKLGWIAQDVQLVFPKSVDVLPEKYGLENVLTLNTDQIYAVMYGSIKKLIDTIETLNIKVETLEEKINSMSI